jgi:hypothetical protein
MRLNDSARKSGLRPERIFLIALKRQTLLNAQFRLDDDRAEGLALHRASATDGRGVGAGGGAGRCAGGGALGAAAHAARRRRRQLKEALKQAEDQAKEALHEANMAHMEALAKADGRTDDAKKALVQQAEEKDKEKLRALEHQREQFEDKLHAQVEARARRARATSEAPSSAACRSFRPMFGRAPIARSARSVVSGTRRPSKRRVSGRVRVREARAREPVWNSNIQPDFNVSVFECFDTISSAGLRELDESDRSVQKSAESTSI